MPSPRSPQERWPYQRLSEHHVHCESDGPGHDNGIAEQRRRMRGEALLGCHHHDPRKSDGHTSGFPSTTYIANPMDPVMTMASPSSEGECAERPFSDAITTIPARAMAIPAAFRAPRTLRIRWTRS